MSGVFGGADIPDPVPYTPPPPPPPVVPNPEPVQTADVAVDQENNNLRSLRRRKAAMRGLSLLSTDDKGTTSLGG